MKTKYPKLEAIHVSEYSQFDTVQQDLARLARNQEKIYALMQEVNDRLKSMEPFIFK